VGNAFPELEIIEVLGVGAMGVVYKARQRKLGRLVALKLLFAERTEHSVFVERFNREGRVLPQLNHPHIVNVFDFGSRGDFLYLLME
jgi:serine/threonine protein kinase